MFCPTSKNMHPSSNKTEGSSSVMNMFLQPFTLSSRHTEQAYFQRSKLKFTRIVKYSTVSVNVMAQINTY